MRRGLSGAAPLDCPSILATEAASGTPAKVTFRFANPYAPLLQQMLHTDGPVIPEHVWDGKPAPTAATPLPEGQNPVGTGPFKFASQNANEIVFERNAVYLKPGPPYLERVAAGSTNCTVVLVQNLFKEGETPQAVRDGTAVSHRMLGDVNVRRAIAAALNRPTFFKDVQQDDGSRVAESAVNSGISWAPQPLPAAGPRRPGGGPPPHRRRLGPQRRRGHAGLPGRRRRPAGPPTVERTPPPTRSSTRPRRRSTRRPASPCTPRSRPNWPGTSRTSTCTSAWPIGRTWPCAKASSPTPATSPKPGGASGRFAGPDRQGGAEMRGHYAARRLVEALVAVAGIQVLTFVLVRMAPGDAVSAIGGETDPRYQDYLRSLLHLDRSLPDQMVTYAGNVLRGRLGNSFVQSRPVTEIIGERLWPTVLLMGTTLVLSSLVGMLLGLLAARRPFGRFDFW